MRVRIAIESLLLSTLSLVLTTIALLYILQSTARKRLGQSFDDQITGTDNFEMQQSNIIENSIDKHIHQKKLIEVVNRIATEKQAPAPKSKSILIYSTLFGLEIWPTLNLEEIKTFMKNCEYSQCTITYDKDEILTADSLLFHGVDVKNNEEFSPEKLKEAAKFRRKDQKWVFFIQESPENYDDFSEYSGLFDWLMSYKNTSDIMIPYGHYKPVTESDSIPDPLVDYTQGKDKLGIWLVSNCGHTRDSFMKELRQYVPITVGGKCALSIFNETTACEYGSLECEKFIKRHKFIFAFENSFCDYYVSEKYWGKGIDWGLVPVVMGARYDSTNVIPGSYIDAAKFDSIQTLAQHLIHLDSNDNEYNKYFEWKQKYKRIGYEKMCELCKALHLNSFREAYHNIWSMEADCKPFQWKIKYMEELVKKSKKLRQSS